MSWLWTWTSMWMWILDAGCVAVAPFWCSAAAAAAAACSFGSSRLTTANDAFSSNLIVKQWKRFWLQEKQGGQPSGVLGSGFRGSGSFCFASVLRPIPFDAIPFRRRRGDIVFASRGNFTTQRMQDAGLRSRAAGRRSNWNGPTDGRMFINFYLRLSICRAMLCVQPFFWGWTAPRCWKMPKRGKSGKRKKKKLTKIWNYKMVALLASFSLPRNFHAH